MQTFIVVKKYYTVIGTEEEKKRGQEKEHSLLGTGRVAQFVLSWFVCSVLYQCINDWFKSLYTEWLTHWTQHTDFSHVILSKQLINNNLVLYSKDFWKSGHFHWGLWIRFLWTLLKGWTDQCFGASVVSRTVKNSERWQHWDRQDIHSSSTVFVKKKYCKWYIM